jgi:hypothetical protein
MKKGVAECKYDFPHPQPFSPRRRELESGSLALWARVRVRAACNSYFCSATPEKVCLDVFDPERQARAIRFYQRLGFKLIDRYNNSLNQVFMEKRPD